MPTRSEPSERTALNQVAVAAVMALAVFAALCSAAMPPPQLTQQIACTVGPSPL